MFAKSGGNTRIQWQRILAGYDDEHASPQGIQGAKQEQRLLLAESVDVLFSKAIRDNDKSLQIEQTFKPVSGETSNKNKSTIERF